jgi:hypothetical protein
MATLVAHGRNRRRSQLAYLRGRRSPGELAALLEEDAVGGAPLSEPQLLTSTTRIQHLHHLLRIEEHAGLTPAAADPVVEWGGGFGGLARLARRLWPGVTVVLVDLPLLSALQWLYLSAVLGEDEVVLLDEPGRPPAAGRVNVLPAPLAAGAPLRAGLFVSTWALSESPAAAQREVAAEGFLGARHLLLAFQQPSRAFPDAGVAADLARAAGARVEPLRGAPGSSYALR